MAPSRARCAYEGCTNTKAKNPILIFHRFPKDEERQLDWIIHSGNDNLLKLDDKQLEAKRLCNDHFTADDFVVGSGMTKLKNIAIPIQKASDTDSNDSGDVEEHDGSGIDFAPTSEDRSVIDLETPFIRERSNNMPQNFVGIDLETSSLIETSHNIPQHFDAAEPSCSGMQSKSNFDCDSTGKSLNANVQTKKYETLVQKLQHEIASLKEQLNKKDKQCKQAQYVTKTMSVRRDVYKQKAIKLSKDIRNKDKKIKNLERKIEKSKEAVSFYDEYLKLNANVLNFFKMQMNHVKLRKWSNDEKEFAVILFYKSPKAYCYLRDQKKFALPCISLIRRWINELDLEPGNNIKLFELLKIKSSTMTVKERECVLMWDEMSIKTWLDYNPKKDLIEDYTDMGKHGRNANRGNYVLVFMLRGRQNDWRQPICYYVPHNSINGKLLHKIILDVIDYVEGTGFLLKSMVCDQRSPNQSAIKELGITKNKPFLERNNRKIFFNFDAPHLLKCLRNTFRKRQFEINEKPVSWDAIRELRNREKDLPTKSVPKLTDRHLDPNAFQLMNVSLAAQIFSNSVSSALLAGAVASEKPFIHPDCIATANFIKKVNDLFDCLNSRSSRDVNPLRRPLSNLNPQVVQYLKDSLNWIETWKCVDKNGNPPCFDGFYLTINSILLQWEDMASNEGVYLLTTRLNQDPLENLFSVLRSRSGHNQNPTAMQVKHNLQYSITANLTSSSKLTNCEPDETVALLAICTKNTKLDLQESLENMTNPMPAFTEDIDDNTDRITCNFLANDNSIIEVNASNENDELINDDIEDVCSEISFDGVNESVHFDENEDTFVEEMSDSDAVVGDVDDNEFQEVSNSLNEGSENLNNIDRSLSSETYDKMNSVLTNSHNRQDSCTPLRGAIKYVAGYIAMKCISKFNCSDCRASFTRVNCNMESNDDLLLFFKAYKVFNMTNELGNLCVPSDAFYIIIITAIETFDTLFSEVSYKTEVSKVLIDKITAEILKYHAQFWITDEPCKSHREAVIVFFVRVHIFNKVKWINYDLRDAKSSRKRHFAGNKPNAKLQKLSHE